MIECPLIGLNPIDAMKALYQLAEVVGAEAVWPRAYADCLFRVKGFLTSLALIHGDQRIANLANFTVDCSGHVCRAPQAVLDVLAIGFVWLPIRLEG